jgi:hypothetical protein
MVAIAFLLYKVGFDESSRSVLEGYLSSGVAVSAVAGVVLGLLWQQSAFLAHDTNHNGMIKPGDKGLKREFNFWGWVRRRACVCVCVCMYVH